MKMICRAEKLQSAQTSAAGNSYGFPFKKIKYSTDESCYEFLVEAKLSVSVEWKFLRSLEKSN